MIKPIKITLLLIIGLLTIVFITASSAAIARPTIVIKNVHEFYQAVAQANKSSRGMIILVQDGHYNLPHRVVLSRENTDISSVSDNPDDVVFIGKGMKKRPSTEILFDIQASNISLRGITIGESANHLIQVRAEDNVDNFSLSNCVLRDAYEQLLKVSGGKHPQHPHSDNGLVENCMFEYTAGVGPQYYIGGIDAHRIRNWRIINNVFRYIASPSDHIAEHAIHIWNDSADNSVIGNLIINSDRGIGFGMGDKALQNSGGIIANNVILHSDKTHPFADTGIILESSPNTVVADNTILLATGYPNAIEYRFSRTTAVVIEGNITNKAIKARNGGSATLLNNKLIRKTTTSLF
jgi:hypothetical protein